jgi:hypothetical protein
MERKKNSMGGFLPIKSDLKLLPIVDNLIRKNLTTYMEDSSDELTDGYGINLDGDEEYAECLNPNSECYAAFIYELMDFFTKRYEYSHQKKGNLTGRLSSWIISDIMKYGFDFDESYTLVVLWTAMEMKKLNLKTKINDKRYFWGRLLPENVTPRTINEDTEITTKNWPNTKYLRKEDKRSVFNFLMLLRDSGITNMFGAASYMGLSDNEMHRILYGMKKDPESLRELASQEEDEEKSEELMDMADLMEKLIEESDNSRNALIRGAMTMCNDMLNNNEDDEDEDKYLNCANRQFRILIKEMLRFYTDVLST